LAFLQGPSQRSGERSAIPSNVAGLCGQRTESPDRPSAHPHRSKCPAAPHGGLRTNPGSATSQSPGLLHHLRHHLLRGGLRTHVLYQVHLDY